MKDYNIYTSYFGNHQLNDKEFILVSTSLKSPDWFPHKLHTFSPCIPEPFTVSSWYRSQKDEEAKIKYIKSYYNSKLATNIDHAHELDRMYSTLQQEYGGNEMPIVLMCFEGSGMFCHRLIYSTYMKLTSGIEIPEFGGLKDTDNLVLTENTLKKLMRGEL